MLMYRIHAEIYVHLLHTHSIQQIHFHGPLLVVKHMAGASNFTVSISITLHGDRSIDTDRGSGKEGERNTQRTPVCVCVCVCKYIHVQCVCT